MEERLTWVRSDVIAAKLGIRRKCVPALAYQGHVRKQPGPPPLYCLEDMKAYAARPAVASRRRRVRV